MGTKYFYFKVFTCMFLMACGSTEQNVDTDLNSSSITLGDLSSSSNNIESEASFYGLKVQLDPNWRLIKETDSKLFLSSNHTAKNELILLELRLEDKPAQDLYEKYVGIKTTMITKSSSDSSVVNGILFYEIWQNSELKISGELKSRITYISFFESQDQTFQIYSTVDSTTFEKHRDEIENFNELILH